MIINITQRQLENKKKINKIEKKKKNSADILRRKYKEFIKETVN